MNMEEKMEIKEMFENIWKVKSMQPGIKKEDKGLYYDLFLDGYGCCIINLEEKEEIKEGNYCPNCKTKMTGDLLEYHKDAKCKQKSFSVPQKCVQNDILSVKQNGCGLLLCLENGKNINCGDIMFGKQRYCIRCQDDLKNENHSSNFAGLQRTKSGGKEMSSAEGIDDMKSKTCSPMGNSQDLKSVLKKGEENEHGGKDGN